MGKVLPVPRLQQGMKVAFEFRDATGGVIQARGANHTSVLLEGTYIPIF